MKTTGNTVLITGGTSGIGFELAKQLIAKGNTVLITGRDQRRLDEARAQLPQVKTFVSDVSDSAAISALYAKVTAEFPELNVLFNNAGIMRLLDLNARAADLSELTLEVVTNLIGPMQMVKQFLPHLQKQPTAAIVNVSSGLAFIPFPMSPIYGASKAGLHSYTQSLRAQLGKASTVKVFELAPPATKTPLVKDPIPGLVDASMEMDVVKLVTAAIRGLEKDKAEILPGMSPMLRLISRLAPGMTLMNKTAETVLAKNRPALVAGRG